LLLKTVSPPQHNPPHSEISQSKITLALILYGIQEYFVSYHHW